MMVHRFRLMISETSVMESPIEQLMARRIAARRSEAAEKAGRVLRALADNGIGARIIGSLAKGTFRLSSDVDILVDCDAALEPEAFRIIEAIMGEFPFHLLPQRRLREDVRLAMMEEAMHPAMALARRRLAETRQEYDSFMLADAEKMAPLDKDNSPAAEWLRVAGRATGIEGVYTGIEGCLREVLNVADGGVSAAPDRFHAQVLAQAAEQTPDRLAIISAGLYVALDALRQFRHRERNVYRHLLAESGVNENLQRLKTAFPKFESEVATFIETWERKPA
jgi:predicted nucleotidyltransferase